MVFLDSVRAEAEPVLRGDARGRSSAASPWVSAGPTACSFRWTLALLTSFLGAKLGANCGRRGAASGRIGLRSLQLIWPTGRCLATRSDGLPTPNPTSVASARVATSYSGALGASGGIPGYTWTVNGSLVP